MYSRLIQFKLFVSSNFLFAFIRNIFLPIGVAILAHLSVLSIEIGNQLFFYFYY